jgi:hydrogenase nickel incorporation protein HypB
VKVTVVKNVLDANNRIAEENRKLFDQHKMFVINLMSSPGAGKTSLVERTIVALRDKYKIAVIEGDIQDTYDADRIAKLDIPVVQINTGGACHLESAMIARAVGTLDLDALDLIIIENVGNLVCPTDFDLGEHAKVMILSVPEGHDKPYKYPNIFQVSEAVILNKCDTMPVFDFDEAEFRSVVARLNPHAPIFPMAATKGDGVAEWAEWLAGRIEAAKGSA